MPDVQPAPEPEAVEQRRFPCAQCGGKLQYAPGTDHLICPYCGHDNEIPKPIAEVREQDFRAVLAQAADAKPLEEHTNVKCDACGALPEMPPDVTSMRCPFCGSNIVSQARAGRFIRPDAVLPFEITDGAARQAFRAWVASRWFAPGKLRREAMADPRLNGIYVPYWTYDADASTQYEGQRGDAYYVPVSYTVVVNGRPQTRTRMERRIRWSYASGVVRNQFDDLLVAASKSLPEKYVQLLEPWPLDQLKPYADDYLSGFGSEAYQIDLPEGFDIARQMMVPTIDSTIRQDIGGDEQRISAQQTRFGSITFKHILLPLWITAYRYKGKLYRILINARTGEVQGERPYSAVKIAFTVLAGLIVLGIIAAVIAVSQR